ncbi:MAG TPA: hypothetical protein VGJ05_19245 [Fimbriiglobus sp.]|jgi:hypothetical protein
MRRFVPIALVGVLAVAVILALGLWLQPPIIPFPIGKETTVAVGPLDKDGYIDYEAALNERTGKGISPEKNANVLLWKAFGPRPEGGTRGMPPEYFKALGMQEPPVKGDYFVSLQSTVPNWSELAPEVQSDIYEQESRASEGPWSAKDSPRIAHWLAVNEKPLAVVVEATKRSEYFNPLCTWRKEEKGPSSLLACLLPNQKCREIIAALTARAMFRVNEGKFDEAWQDLVASHRLARLVGRDATMIEFLVGVAFDAVASKATLAYLERANLSSQEIRDRLKVLQTLPPMPPLADKINLGERFIYLDCVQMIRRGGVGMLEGLSGGGNMEKPTAAELKGLTRIDWAPALRDGNKWYDRLADASRAKSRAEREKLLDQLEQDVKKLKKKTADSDNLAKLIAAKLGFPDKEVGQEINNAMISLLLPAVGKVMTAADRCEQTHRNLLIAFALATFHKDNGKYPSKLDELAPKYLTSVPVDYFNNKPLTYRVEGKGYVFYSVGPNGKDDGGRWINDDPPGDDLGVRMPLPGLKGNALGKNNESYLWFPLRSLIERIKTTHGN